LTIHQIFDIPVGGVLPTQRGEVIAIMHRYALADKGKLSIQQGDWNGTNMMSMTNL